MHKKKKVVAFSTESANAAIAPNLEQITKQLGMLDLKSLKIYYKKGKVTTNCTLNGKTIGSRGLTTQEALFRLITKVNQEAIS